MKRQIFIAKDNQPQGPFSEDELGLKLISGEIEVGTLACEDGAPAWKPLGEVLDPKLVSRMVEYRRASQTMSAQMHSQPPPASVPPPSAPPAPPAPGASMFPKPAHAGMPVISVLEPNGQPIQVPAQSFAPSVFLTSMPVAAQSVPPPAIPVTATVPAATGAGTVPPPAPVSHPSLATEAIGGSETGAPGKRRGWMIAGGVAAALGVGTFFAWEPVSNTLKAKQEFQRAQAAMANGQFAEAMAAARVSSSLAPDSGIYLNAWQDARRKALDSLKGRLGKEPPLDHLIYAREFLAKYEGALGDDGLAATKEWIAETEPQAIRQIKGGFDGDIAALNGLLARHEGKLGTYFNAADNRDEAKRLQDQWVALRDAHAAWAASQPLKTVELLGKISEDLRKGAAYAGLAGQTSKMKDGLLEKLHGATDLAAAKRFNDTAAVFQGIDAYDTWLPEIKQEKQRIQMAGENYYASRLVAAVRAKNADATRENLNNYMRFRGRPLTESQLTEFLEIREFKEYLSKLTEYGLHPRGKAARQNYADVVLVASNLPNFSDADDAKEFLGDSYMEWGRAELEKGRSSPAAYLALLAGKYGHPAAPDLFESAHDKILAEFTIALRASPLVINAAKASKSFASQLEIDSLNALRNSLPPWLKWQTPDNTAAGEAEPLLAVKVTPILAEFNRRNDRVARTASARFRFEDIIEDNPDYYSAQQDVNNAQASLQSAIDQRAAAQASANQMASQNYGNSSGLALFGAVLSGVTQGVSEAGVNNARQALADAQNRVASTPRQVRKENSQNVTWNEFDYVSDFNAVFKLELKVGDKTILAKSCTASTRHTSTEREGGFGGRVKAMQRQEPSMDEIEIALTEQLKPQLQALGAPAFLGQIKSGIAAFITQQAGTVDAEAQANALIGLELLWWKHPLYNAAALRSPDLLGRFGDVVN